jgi:hypothetical protein
MKNKLFLTLALSAFALVQAGRAAALDFQALSRPLTLSETSIPAASAPAKAAPQGCRPFLLSVSVGGVGEAVVMERACTADNQQVWVLMIENVRDRKMAARVSSDKYPAERALIEKRIKAMVIDGMTQEDANMVVTRIGPLLRDAAAVPQPEKDAILAEAEARLKDYLARP